MKNFKVKVSKLMSYLLRHNPKNLEMSENGFILLDSLVKEIQKRYSWANVAYIKDLVAKDKKGRYEILDGKIRARYGHSIKVKIRLPLASPKRLYHGTSKASSEKILMEGLRPMGRQKVHLSQSIEDAIQVGKRKTSRPVILEIDSERAVREGIKIEKASERIYVANYIPAKFIKILNKI